MRAWVWFLFVPFAGCIDAPEEPARDRRILLLGEEPCHAGTCFVARDALLEARGLRPLVRLDDAPGDFAAGSRTLHWFQDGTLWGLDRDTRELHAIATWSRAVDGSVVAEGDRAWFVSGEGGDAVWRWDWSDRQTTRVAAGFTELLDVHEGAVLGVRDDAARSLARIEGNRVSVLVEAGQGRVYGQAQGHSTMLAVDDGSGSPRVWLEREGSLSPVGLSVTALDAVAFDGRYIAAHEGDATAVRDTIGGDDVVDGAGAFIALDRGIFHWHHADTWFASELATRSFVQVADVAGLVLGPAHASDDEVVVSLDGDFRGFAAAPVRP